MTRLLLDTHIWFWYLTGSARLATSLRDRVDASAASGWLSPVSVWELAMLVERRRVEIDGDYRAWVDVALRRAPVEQAALTFDVALRSREIDLPHQDPADRFLAATALAYDLVLVTVDEHLTAADWLPTLSE